MRIFNFHDNFPIDCSDLKNPCYSVEQLVELALINGMEAREKRQHLFQSFKEAKVKKSHLLPELNLFGSATSVLDGGIVLEAIASLTGFLFPSRWLEWKAARMIREAEKEALRATFGNIAQHVQHLYFETQQQIWSIRVLNFYMDEIDKLVKFLEQQKNEENVEVLDDDIAALENIKARMVYDRAFIDALSAILPQLATAIGFTPHKDWSQLKLVPYEIRSLTYMTEREYLEFWPMAFERSPEIKGMEFLLGTAKKNMKSVFYDWLDPESGTNLGFGFKSRVKTFRSKVKAAEIQLQRTQMQLSNAIQDSLNNYNDSVISFPSMELGVNSLEKMRVMVERIINDKSIPIDINKIARYFDYAERQALRHINSQIVFRIAEADLQRYTWNSGIYDVVQKFVDHEIQMQTKKKKKKVEQGRK